MSFNDIYRLDEFFGKLLSENVGRLGAPNSAQIRQLAKSRQRKFRIRELRSNLNQTIPPPGLVSRRPKPLLRRRIYQW